MWWWGSCMVLWILNPGGGNISRAQTESMTKNKDQHPHHRCNQIRSDLTFSVPLVQIEYIYLLSPWVNRTGFPLWIYNSLCESSHQCWVAQLLNTFFFFYCSLTKYKVIFYHVHPSGPESSLLFDFLIKAHVLAKYIHNMFNVVWSSDLE